MQELDNNSAECFYKLVTFLTIFLKDNPFLFLLSRASFQVHKMYRPFENGSEIE